ncbi:MAG: signal peptidase I [Chitinophagales bacterium]
MIYIIVAILLLIGYLAGLYLWFEKAGVAGWKALVPYLRIKNWIELTDKPKWFIWGSFVPVLNLFIYTNLIGETSDTYRRHSFWEHSVAIVFGFFWLPYLGLNKDEKYYGPKGETDGYKKPKKSKVREWADAIIFAIFAAYFIRTFIFEIYAIPTSSMEGTLRVGDVLVVSKFHYGSRIPNTPIAFPLVHHSFPKILGGTKSYLEWIKLPYKRLPKIQNVKRNDMVVFNFPANDTTTKEYDSALPYYDLVRRAELEGAPNPREAVKEQYTVVYRPVDKRENYIKRCVGLPGDTLQIKGGTLFINGEKAYLPENAQFRYLVTTNGSPISNDEFYKVDITEFNPIQGINNAYEIYTSAGKAEKLKLYSQVNEVKPFFHNAESDYAYYEYTYYPYNKDFKWNVDNYGPIIIPKKGMTVELNKHNYLLYQRCIRVYENNTLEIKNGQAVLNGSPVKEYTFKMDYYWMMGDNRHRSQDSRYWGFVPEDHIVGKAWFLVASYSKENSFLRLNRFFRGIHSNWAPKDKKFTE